MSIWTKNQWKKNLADLKVFRWLKKKTKKQQAIKSLIHPKINWAKVEYRLQTLPTQRNTGAAAQQTGCF